MLGIELLGLKVAVGAAYNVAERYDPSQCRPYTRVAVLSKIMDWIEARHNRRLRFMWSSWDREVGNCTDDRRNLLRSRATCCKLLFSDCS